jgi:Tol biopolymer transport system component
MSATGGNPHAITSQNYNAYNPVWSPDGRSIAFDEQVGTTEEVRVVARTGGKVHVLTKGSNPGWQPIP